MKKYYKQSAPALPDFYTDMAVERRRADSSVGGIEYRKEPCTCGTWERVRVTSDEGARCIGRPIGRYDTLKTERLDLFDEEDLYDVQEELARELIKICDDIAVMPARILAVGLGNEELTPDSVGAKCARLIKPTMHIREESESFFSELECSEIAVLIPSVAAKSGMRSTECVRGICERIMPDLIIAVDAIRTDSHERLGRCFQLSDTGIFPGGMGATGDPLTRPSLGVPVIGIGIPTVMDARCLGEGALSCLTEELYVSPKDIDEIVASAARAVAGAVNQAFGLDY